ncbi:MAG TPA: DUF433 domain-containing protein [Chloroflexota bacterium]|nr:DUF433 domain-containing protein [Chloroflexota bacterium]
MLEDSLIGRYVELDPRRPWSGEARLRDSGVPVWALVGHWLNATKGDAEAVAHDYDLPLDAVIAALAFYRRHKPLIDARLAENSATSVA